MDDLSGKGREGEGGREVEIYAKKNRIKSFEGIFLCHAACSPSMTTFFSNTHVFIKPYNESGLRRQF